MKNKIAILDIETTDFINDGGKIVEVGIVELDINTGYTKIVYNKVTHETGITRQEVENSWIIANSDLTVEAVMHSTNLTKLKPEIQAVIDSYPSGITAYNNAFDYKFMKDRGFILRKTLPCPMRVSRNIVCAKDKRGRVKAPTVEEAYKYFFPNEKYIEKHRGADDALHEAKIVFKLIELGVLKI